MLRSFIIFLFLSTKTKYELIKFLLIMITKDESSTRRYEIIENYVGTLSSAFLSQTVFNFNVAESSVISTANGKIFQDIFSKLGEDEHPTRNMFNFLNYLETLLDQTNPFSIAATKPKKYKIGNSNDDDSTQFEILCLTASKGFESSFLKVLSTKNSGSKNDLLNKGIIFSLIKKNPQQEVTALAEFTNKDNLLSAQTVLLDSIVKKTSAMTSFKIMKQNSSEVNDVLEKEIFSDSTSESNKLRWLLALSPPASFSNYLANLNDEDEVKSILAESYLSSNFLKNANLASILMQETGSQTYSEMMVFKYGIADAVMKTGIPKDMTVAKFLTNLSPQLVISMRKLITKTRTDNPKTVGIFQTINDKVMYLLQGLQELKTTDESNLNKLTNLSFSRIIKAFSVKKNYLQFLKFATTKQMSKFIENNQEKPYDYSITANKNLLNDFSLRTKFKKLLDLEIIRNDSQLEYFLKQLSLLKNCYSSQDVLNLKTIASQDYTKASQKDIQHIISSPLLNLMLMIEVTSISITANLSHLLINEGAAILNPTIVYSRNFGITQDNSEIYAIKDLNSKQVNITKCQLLSDFSNLSIKPAEYLKTSSLRSTWFNDLFLDNNEQKKFFSDIATLYETFLASLKLAVFNSNSDIIMKHAALHITSHTINKINASIFGEVKNAFSYEKDKPFSVMNEKLLKISSVGKTLYRKMYSFFLSSLYWYTPALSDSLQANHLKYNFFNCVLAESPDTKVAIKEKQRWVDRYYALLTSPLYVTFEAFLIEKLRAMNGKRTFKKRKQNFRLAMTGDIYSYNNLPSTRFYKVGITEKNLNELQNAIIFGPKYLTFLNELPLELNDIFKHLDVTAVVSDFDGTQRNGTTAPTHNSPQGAVDVGFSIFKNNANLGETYTHSQLATIYKQDGHILSLIPKKTQLILRDLATKYRIRIVLEGLHFHIDTLDQTPSLWKENNAIFRNPGFYVFDNKTTDEKTRFFLVGDANSYGPTVMTKTLESGLKVLIIDSTKLLTKSRKKLRKATLDTIVVHTTGGWKASSAINWFQNDGENTDKTAAHFIIDANESGTEAYIYQLSPTKYRLNHAGVGKLVKANERSIGIENVGMPIEKESNLSYPKRQKAISEACLFLINKLKSKLAIQNIMGHYHHAPTRKSDPGKYFFKKFKLSNPYENEKL